MSRLESVDDELQELGYPDASCAHYHEFLFVSARNFAAQADRMEVELTQLRDEVQYALDRLANREDQGPGLRELIDDATGKGDFFPICELKRRKDQIHEINEHFGSFIDFSEGLIDDLKILREALPECWRLNEQGELVQDVAVVPKMEVWVHVNTPCYPGGRKVTQVHRRIVTEVSYMGFIRLTHGDDVQAKNVSNSREAAEAASKEGAS